MRDFSEELRCAININFLPQLIANYNADPTLDYSVSKAVVKISPFAFYETLGGLIILQRQYRIQGCMSLITSEFLLADPSEARVQRGSSRRRESRAEGCVSIIFVQISFSKKAR